WQRVVGLCVTIGVVLVVYAVQANGDAFRDRHVQNVYACVFTGLMAVLALVISATAIAQEKEGDTWTLLLAAPVGGRTIVWGKAFGVLRRLLGPALLITLHFLLFTIVGVISVRAFLVILWAMFSFNSVWVATGVYFSLRCRKVTVAVIVNLLLAIGTYVVLPGILAVISAYTESRTLVQQVSWYLPYYYEVSAVEEMRPAETAIFRASLYADEERRIWLPSDDHVAWPEFMAIAFIVGCAHLVAACLVIAHTAYHFNSIVGRAPQRHKLTYADNLRSEALPRMRADG
ncbi:MAG: hypothetical protein JWN51_3091, partial [Phycisphaerales bacterium]|nr:hypothetical protein [Phycisphaerales bacterium]